MQIAIIGGGAAGCFAAIALKRRCPQAAVTVYEGGRRLLAKVAVTGGGRCNLTNSFGHVRSLAAVYPRGERLMKRLLREFSHEDTQRWFETEGVRLVTQDDGCVFPRSQSAMEIVDTLIRLLRQTGVRVMTGHRVRLIEKTADGGNSDPHPAYRISFADCGLSPVVADTVVVTTGGLNRSSGPAMLSGLGADIVEPVPSLFSLCLPDDGITEMTGTVVADVTARIAGTKMQAAGPLLITHWGMSGPAILKLSAYAARLLSESAYRATLSVNWLGDATEADVRDMLSQMAADNPRKLLPSAWPPQLNARLWACLLQRSGVSAPLRWCEAGRKDINRMVNELTNSQYRVEGKCRFKEEFVTCGGVSLASVDPRTLECRTSPGIYFAGEVLDVDGITGGFNLQAAWTMGYVVAKSIAGSMKQE